MKSIKLLIIMAVCLLSISCSAQRILSDVASMKGVTSIYIGKTMLNIAGSSMALGKDKSAIDISKIMKGLTSIEIIQCEDSGVASEVQRKCKEVLSKYPFEVITEVTDDNQNVEISGVFEKEGEFLKMLLISVSDNNQPTFILLKGKISTESLNNALIEIDD